MTGRPIECVAIVLILVASAACHEASDSSASADDAGTEDHFASFARSFFAELWEEPLDEARQIDIGLFGDLSMSDNERVVMRRYRYRVDSAEFGPVARMAFQVRDSLEREAPVPVVLTFALREGAWRLEQAEFRSPDSLDSIDSEAEIAPLQRLLRANFDEWLDSAIQRTNASPET